MATFNAIGPAVSLDGPLPEPPEHSLLMTPGVWVEQDERRLLNGVNVYGYPSGCSDLWEPCSDGTFRVKEVNAVWPQPRFDSFVVYQGIECSTISQGGDPEDLYRRISAALDATLSAGVEKGLAQGVDGSSNPFIGDANVDDLTNGTAVSSGVGLSMIENAIGRTCKEGMIGTTPAVIVSLQAFPVGGVDDNRLETANGTPVYSADGFIGLDTTDLPTPGATEDYILGTGPIRVYTGPVSVTTPAQSIDRSTNVLTYFAERYVLAIWDTALQAAALVDWAT